MHVAVVFAITLPLTTLGVWCAPGVSTVDLTKDKVEKWRSGSDERPEERDVRSLRRYPSNGRRRLKRDSDNTHSYKDALYISPNTAYLQKHQTHYLRCPSWQQEERLSSLFWYRGSTRLVKFSAPNERGKNFTASERYRLLDDQSGLIIYNVTDDDGGLYDCRVVPTATKKERKGMVTVQILDSTLPADAVSMDSINIPLLSQNINRQDGGRIKCPHSTTDAAATYWSLYKGEGVDTEIIGAEYSNKDTLILDKFKEDYQIENGGDLQILSLQRPQSRFWCHRFLNGMAVGYVNVTGVVLTNQDRPIITGCEPLPGDECQVYFDPDKDHQLDCAVLNVYPKVTLHWEDVSKCDINFQETSLESFDDVTNTYDQFQRLVVKAGSFSADCQPKFVCNATGVAIPVQPFGAEVLKVKSGSRWIIIVAVVIALVLFSIILLIFVKRKRILCKMIAKYKSVGANEIECDAIKSDDRDTGCHSFQDCEKAVDPTTKEYETKQQSCENEGDALPTAKQQSRDESKTLVSHESRSEELTSDEFGTDHVEIHPSGSNSFSPRKWLMQAQNIVVHIHQHVSEKRPTKRNGTKSKRKNYGKERASYQPVLGETDTELSPSGQHNMKVQMHKSSSSPPLSNMADSTFEGEPGDEGNVSALHEDSVIQKTLDTHDDPQENDDQQMPSSEAASEHQLKVELHHDTKEEQNEQQIADEAKSDLHLDQDEVNLQSEDPLDISISENEAGSSDPLIGASSETKTSPALDDTPSEIQNDIVEDNNMPNKAPEPSPAGLGKISPKLKKSPPKKQKEKKKGKKKKKPAKSNDVSDKNEATIKPEVVVKQAARNSEQPLVRDVGNGPGEEMEPDRSRLLDSGIWSNPSQELHFTTQQDVVTGKVATEERSTDQSTDQQVTHHVDNHVCSAEPSPVDPLLDHTTNDEVQYPHQEDPIQQQPDYYSNTPVQQADPITTQPSASVRLVELVPTQGPARENPTEQEPDTSFISLPNTPPTQIGTPPSPSMYTSPDSNTSNHELDDSPKMYFHEPSLPTYPQAPLADQNHHDHVQLPVGPLQSDDCEPTPGVGLDTNVSKYPNRLPSEDEEMGSEKGDDSGNEMGDCSYHDVSDDVGYDQQHETTPVEMVEAVADDNPQVSNREVEMTDPEDENVERPKRDPKERASTASNLRKKQNLLKTNNFVDQRLKVLAAH